MNTVFSRGLVFVSLTACFSASLSMADEPAAATQQTIWNVGRRYDTVIKIKIDISNANLVPSTNFNLKGSFLLPHLSFQPVYRIRTDDTRQSGANFFTRRTYVQPEQRVEGTKNIEWKTDGKWYSLGRRWCNWWSIRRNKDIQTWKEESERLAKESQKNGYTFEKIPVFHDDEHRPVSFDPITQSLLLQWSEDSIRNFFNEEPDEKIVRVFLGGINDGSDALMRARGAIPEAGFEIRRKIVAECNVLSYILYNDPSGNRRSLLKNAQEWPIDAGSLNKGLLKYGGMDRLIKFEGSLKVRRDDVSIDDCRRIGVKRFNGEKISVLDSKKAKVGYDIGHGYKMFPLSIDFARRDDPEANMMEFWFDADNNVLRYAKIRIVKKDYKGNIPNPRLGRITSALQGNVNGRVAFELEYWTAIDEKLADIDN